MRKEAVRREPYALPYVPDHFKAQKMCEKAIEEDPWQLYSVPDRFKTKRMLKMNQKPYNIYRSF